MRLKSLPALLLPLTLVGCLWGGDDAAYQGYVEGDYVRVAAEYGGRVAMRAIDRGDSVAAGDILFRIDDREASLRLAEAEARLAQAEAQQTSAAANLAAAVKDYDRVLALRRQNVTTPAQLDAAAERRDAASGNLTAAQRNVAALSATAEVARNALQRHTVTAAAAGRVDEVYFEPGEYAAPGQPVISLLPAGNRRILFFIPETDLARIALGDRIAIACDDCVDNLTAVVTVISSNAEFTPPVIFSRETRTKLVFRVEARPEGATAELKVGQPIDIARVDGAD